MSLLTTNFGKLDTYKPVTVGHRGFKNSYPENTISALVGAVEAGATILETDIQVSKDGVVVMCHDATTLRCFGSFHQVASTNYYGEMDQLKTLQHPHDKMPTFEQVCELFAYDKRFEGVKLMLDVKRDNEPWVLQKVVNVLKKVNSNMEFWAEKMVLGVWREDVFETCHTDAPFLKVVHIGLSRSMAKRFLSHDQCIGISIHHLCLKMPGGIGLIESAQKMNKLVFAWTVNNLPTIKWAISANIDGIVTDNPDVLAEFVDNITQSDIDSLYSTADPVQFYTKLELIVLFPWLYLKARLMFLWAVIIQMCSTPRAKVD